MKRRNVSFFCMAMMLASPALAQGNSCSVTGLRGDAASVWRNGSAARLESGSVLANDDRIETGAGTVVTIECTDEMRITVGPQSSLNLGDLTKAEKSWAASLLEGISGFSRPVFGGDRFEVRTPSAVASVRSTEWIVSVEAGATTVFVETGSVDVLARQGGGTLESGEGIDVSPDGVAGPVRVWSAERVRRTRERLGSPPE